MRFFIIHKINYIIVFCLIFVDCFCLNEFIYNSKKFHDYNFDYYYIIKRFITFDFDNFFIHFFFKIDSFKLKMNIYIIITNDITCSFKIMKKFYKMIFRNFNSFLFNINNKFFKRINFFIFVETFTIVDIFKSFQYVKFLFKINVVTSIK